MAKHLLRLTQANREAAHKWVDKAIQAGNGGKAWMMEVREPRRSDDQNSALWSLLSQITKQRPEHNGRAMTAELWKSVFLDALGHEQDYLPSLDGKRIFPMGHRSSALSKAQFSDLLELILAWTAEQGLTIKHFDDTPPHT